MLPHQAKEIDRLQRQHRFMKSSTEGVFLAIPALNDKETFRVLDSGCADGKVLLPVSLCRFQSAWI